VIERITTRKAIRQLRDELERVRRENAAILRLLSGPRTEGDVLPAVPPGLTRDGLFSEVERGSRAEVMAKLEPYVPLFTSGGPVVDLGCGRGEFLELAPRRGLEAYGVDTDADSVRRCTEIGLDAREENLFDHLAGLPDDSLGGVFCSQVVEHLPPELLPALMEQIARVLRPGGIADVALGYAARTAGLVVTSTIYTSLPPESERLKPVPPGPGRPETQRLAKSVNATVHQLNGLLYGPQDYALVLSKPA
jgi:SAM-dependent methyltransferase